MVPRRPRARMVYRSGRSLNNGRFRICHRDSSVSILLTMAFIRRDRAVPVKYCNPIFWLWLMVLAVSACGGTSDSGGALAVSGASDDPGQRVVLQTSAGDITVELDAAKAPLTVENFVNYATNGHYDGTVFHRVIAGFMIQGGGFTAEYIQKPTLDPVANEADNGLKNIRYTIAMARTSDPQSATSQFFINVADNDFLNYTAPTSSSAWGYAVFGEVTDGFEVVDQIAASATGAAGPFTENVPVQPVVINSVVIN